MKKIFQSSIYLFYLFVFLLVGCKSSEENKPDNSIDAASEIVKDIDGNVYHTVRIGTQVWMVENLKVTRLNDGTSISKVNNEISWYNLTSPGLCWYNDDIENYKTFGALYNWYAVNSGKLAPKGWHIPSSEEWKVLINYLGGESVAGGKLKEKGTTHWRGPNSGATNESGFTALPAGERGHASVMLSAYNSLGENTIFWSTTERGMSALVPAIHYDTGMMDMGDNYGEKWYGWSVRCIKD